MSCKLEHGLESWSPSNFQFSNIYNIRPAVSCIQPQDVFVIKCRSNSAHTKLIICTSYFSAAWCHLSNSHQPRFLFVRGAEHFSLLPHSWCENSKFGVILTISEAAVAVADICRGNWWRVLLSQLLVIYPIWNQIGDCYDVKPPSAALMCNCPIVLMPSQRYAPALGHLGKM